MITKNQDKWSVSLWLLLLLSFLTSWSVGFLNKCYGVVPRGYPEIRDVGEPMPWMSWGFLSAQSI